MTPCRQRSILVSLLALHGVSIATSAAPSSSTLDLSFLHRVKSSTLADAIRHAMDEAQDDVIDIDVSSSLIGKDINDIVQLLEGKGREEAIKSTINLKARSNQWTQKEAAMLLKAVTTNEVKNEEKDTQQKSDETNVSTEEEKVFDSPVSVVALDLSWNDLGQSNRESRTFLKSLQKLVEESGKNNQERNFVLRLDVCGLSPAACRALGKGIIARYENGDSSKATEIKPLSLHLTRNENIGDAGAAALSAAIRSVVSKNKGLTVFDVLDLSGCGIGDTGVEALAIALEDHPLCVRHLILSNNKISDEGAAALGRAFSSDQGGGLETLDLSNNKDIGDSGALSIADILEKGTCENLVLRSCHVHADGMTSIGKALKALGSNKDRPKTLSIDLSGNPLGILRKKAKSSGYSATALKSKATATTAAYMNLIGKTVQRGLKEIGLAENSMGGTLESDDEEEARMNADENGFGGQDQSEITCGALAFADAFIDDEDTDGDSDDEEDSSGKEMTDGPCNVKLGLRRCAFDTRAAEALAAVVQEAKTKKGLDIHVDTNLNDVLEDEMVSALSGDKEFESDLSEMADKHLEAMEALRLARKRSLEAAKAAAARMKTEAEMEASWGTSLYMGEADYDDEDVWDSDADYDEQEDYDDYF